MLILLGRMITPVGAQSELSSAGETHLSTSFINRDWTLNLNGTDPGSIDLQGWEVQIDQQCGPVFSPKGDKASFPLLQPAPGDWAALGSNPAGNDGALNNGVGAVAISGTDVYVGGGFTNAAGIAAAEAAEPGLQAALEAVKSAHKRLHVFAALDTMEYLKRSGRAPATVAMLGSLLHIKPLIELTNGEVKAIGAVRTTSQANERMSRFLLDGGMLERLAILHTGAESRARDFLNELMQKSSQSVPRDILMVNVTTVIGTHVGPNRLGFAAVRK